VYERAEAVASLCRGGHCNVWDPADGRCLSASAAPLLAGAAPATAAALLPGRTHVVVAGEAPSLLLLELGGMSTRVLAQCPDWPMCVAAARLPDGRVRVACVDASIILHSWAIELSGRAATPFAPVQLAAACDGATEREEAQTSASRLAAQSLPRSVALSDDLSLLLLHAADGSLTVHALEPPAAPEQHDAGAPPLPMGLVRRRAASEQRRVSARRPSELLRLPPGWHARLVRSPAAEGGGGAGPWQLLAWGCSADAQPLLLRVPSKAQASAALAQEWRSLSPCGSAAGCHADADASPPAAGCPSPFYTDAALAPPPRRPSDPDAAADATRAGSFVLATQDGDLHLFTPALPNNEAGAPLTRPAGAPLGLRSRWPLAAGWATEPALGKLTASAPVLSSSAACGSLLLGYSSGRVVKMALPSGKQRLCDARHAHDAPVTALIALRGAGPAAVLASADALGSVRLWSLEGLEPLARLREHTGAVVSLLQPPPAAEELPLGGAPPGAALVSVGTDGALVLYALGGGPFAPEEHSAVSMRVSLLLGGHALPIRQLCWRTAEGLLLSCASASASAQPTLYAWQLSSGRLERAITPPDAAAHVCAMAGGALAGCHLQPVVDAVGPLSLPGIRGSSACVALRLVGADEPEAYSEAASDNGGGSSFAPEPPLAVTFFNVRRLVAHAKREAAREGRSMEPELADDEWAEERPAETPSAAAPPDAAVARLALSYLPLWGVDGRLDAAVCGALGVAPPAAQLVAYGVCGHGGRLSFLCPRAPRWQASPHLSALWSLAAIATANTLVSRAGDEQLRTACSSLVSHISVGLPSLLPRLCAPSLSLLARHYCDASEEIQAAAHALLEGAMARMTPETRKRVVEAWLPRAIPRLAAGASAGLSRSASGCTLASAASSASASPLPARPPARPAPPPALPTARPPAPPELSSPQGVAVLVLGVLVCRFGAAMDAEAQAGLAARLVAMLSAPSEPQRQAAAELLSKGYRAWRPHLRKPAELIRLLFVYATAHAAAVAPGQPAAANRFHAALLQVGVLEPSLFCEEMGEQAVRMAAPPRVRLAAVASVVALVKSRAASLEAELPLVVETALRSLDPSVPSLREGSLAASTSALRELVRRYSMVHFNQPTQRLAVRPKPRRPAPGAHPRATRADATRTDATRTEATRTDAPPRALRWEPSRAWSCCTTCGLRPSGGSCRGTRRPSRASPSRPRETWWCPSARPRRRSAGGVRAPRGSSASSASAATASASAPSRCRCRRGAPSSSSGPRRTRWASRATTLRSASLRGPKHGRESRSRITRRGEAHTTYSDRVTRLELETPERNV